MAIELRVRGRAGGNPEGRPQDSDQGFPADAGSIYSTQFLVEQQVRRAEDRLARVGISPEDRQRLRTTAVGLARELGPNRSGLASKLTGSLIESAIQRAERRPGAEDESEADRLRFEDYLSPVMDKLVQMRGNTVSAERLVARGQAWLGKQENLKNALRFVGAGQVNEDDLVSLALEAERASLEAEQ